MALNAYLNLKGQKQGQFKGSVTQKGREGSVMVVAATHGIDSPRDLATGLASGKRQHKPIVITKELDKSSPQFYAAVTSNELITEWLLTFYQNEPVGGAGAEKAIYTIKLTNATVATISFTMPNTQEPDQAKLPEYEQVAFTYEKIEWTWLDGGMTAMDSWAARP